jgi:hypothetical protein
MAKERVVIMYLTKVDKLDIGIQWKYFDGTG